MTSIPAAELWRRVARAANVDAVYGAPYGPLDVTRLPDAVAPLLAAAHQRVHHARAAVHCGGGLFRLPAFGTGPRRTVTAATADALLAARPELSAPGEVEVRLTLDPTQPVDDVLPAPAPNGDSWVEVQAGQAAAVRAAANVVVLAGPGVIRDGAVPGLHDLAVAAGIGVLNTWGAKGVFDWRSQHHLATVGLQAEDFVLGGLEQADLIIATGLDPDESPEARWKLAPALHVPPGGLAPLAQRCGPSRGVPAMPPLRTRLADVTQRGWTVDGAPVPPSRVTLHYAECLSAGALIAADAGTAGFWVARTLGTTRLGAVIVPPTPQPGLAAACVAVSLLRHPSRPGLAVVDGPVGPETEAVIDAMATLGLHVPLEVWDPEGEQLGAEAHRQRLRRAVFGGGTAGAAVPTVATDPQQLVEMVAAAGPIVAWT